MAKSVPSQPKIVVIDHDHAYRELLCEVLTSEHYTVVSSECSHGAFDLIDREQPDALILDVSLEDRDAGLIILDMLRLHRRTSSIPVLICSGNEQLLQEHALAFKEHQCLMLHKPFNLETLLQKVRQALALSHRS